MIWLGIIIGFWIAIVFVWSGLITVTLHKSKPKETN